MKNAKLAMIVGAVLSLSGTVARAEVRPGEEIPISIEAQAMDQALNALAQQTGVQLLFRAETLGAGLTAPRLVGSFTVQSALDRLLANTDLSYRFLDERTVTIRSAKEVAADKTSAVRAQPGSMLTQVASSTLAPSGSSDARADSSTSRPDETIQEVIVLGKGYGTQVGAKSLAPLLEVPNTITVIDQERIKEQNMFTLEDVALQTTGLGTTGSDSDLFQFVSRGFVIDNYLIDGVPNNGFSGEIPTLFLYDRVEVLRGPAGLFSGSGSPAGSINLVRKRPLAEETLDLSLAAGSWDNYRGEIDYSKPISDKVGARAGFSYQDKDQFYDGGQQERTVGYGVLDFDLTEATRLTVGGHYDDFSGSFFSGFPGLLGGGLADFSRSTGTGADWSGSDFTTKAGFAELRHAFDNNWVVRLSGQYGNLDTRIKGAYPISFTGITPEDGTGALLASAFYRDLDYLTVDFNAVGTFSLWGRQHELLIGADYQDRTSTNMFFGRDFLGDYDYYNPVRNIPEAPITFSDTTEFKTEQKGIYGQVRYTLIDPLKFVFGGRVSWYEDSTTLLDPPPATQTASSKTDARFTPYAGLVWTPASGWSVYASFANTFQPQEALSASGGNLPPVTGDQIELGVKAGLLDERLLLTLAGYRIKQSNLAIPAFEPGTYLASGEVTAEGFDIELNGEILPGWRVNGGYAYIDLKDEAEAGAEASIAVPEHEIKLWTHYSPQGGALDKFRFGGGVNWRSETDAALLFFGNGTGVTQPSYAIVSLQLGYEIADNILLTLNGENLTDKKYYQRISGTEFGNFFGPPRSVLATLRLTF